MLSLHFHCQLRHGTHTLRHTSSSFTEWVLTLWRRYSISGWAARAWERIRQWGATRRALYGSTSARPKPRYNYDVLECILHHLPLHDLPQAALVCQEWALASRMPLYARLEFDSNAQSAPPLARTLRTCPNLRSLVQYLELHISIHENDTAAFDWLHLMPEGNVTELVVYHCAFDKDFTTFILRSPFIRSVRILKGTGDFIQTKEHLHGCLTLPHLESLSVYVSDGLEVIQPVPVPPKLTRLSLSSYTFPVSTIPLLAAAGPQLERFDLDSGMDPPLDEELPDFVAALEDYARQLRALTIRSKHYPEIPYADHLVHLIPTLEYLHLGYKTFSSSLYLDLPKRLHTLRLEHAVGLEFPFTNLEEMIARSGCGENSLRSLAIFVRGKECDTSPFMRIGDLCHQNGIAFSFTTYSPSVNQWSDGSFLSYK
ncbi:hypothetical protein OBBRIDRAFT_790889 [Obba rivulosa]|uniref:F-box domain-containing protein n=1 Tax=Obba rivulosa TaxID=1052685 RepID=A0A8E2B614_9APHY|nr:hypothetical protein OBBRIDRAFT_790889 [Obba rivulosa]